jgi:hypothetical protein
MGKLKLNRKDGKKGSKLRLIWTESEIAAFHELKRILAETLELWQVDVDKPFQLRCDASDFAIGAELRQKFGGEYRTVGLFSRKLTKSQLNWAVGEKESYAVVAALLKWAGLIGFQPVVVTSDHKSLESWATEHVMCPGGPRNRRARWHELLSQFDLTLEYIPGKDNSIADAMSRFAYPASTARQDVTIHGSLESAEEVKKMIEDEFEQAKTLRVLVRKRGPTAIQREEFSNPEPKFGGETSLQPISQGGEDIPSSSTTIPKFSWAKPAPEAKPAPKAKPIPQAEPKPKPLPKPKPAPPGT